jgi:hypothetical protein
MNVMEEALVDIKETSATLISNQQQDKTEVVNEIDNWKRSMNQSSGNINTSELFDEKELCISSCRSDVCLSFSLILIS